MYHNIYWVNAKGETDKTYETFSEKDYINALSDVEITHFGEKEMTDASGKVLDMNITNETYQCVLSLNDKNEALINHNYKKHLKELISKNVCRISFVNSKNPSKPDQLISDSTTNEILDTSIKECTADNIDQIRKVAKFICSEMLQREKLCFSGLFNNFTLPHSLATLIRWILIGKNHCILFYIIDMIPQLMLSNQFCFLKQENRLKFYHTIEMSGYLLSKSLALKLVFPISDFWLSILI